MRETARRQPEQWQSDPRRAARGRYEDGRGYDRQREYGERTRSRQPSRRNAARDRRSTQDARNRNAYLSDGKRRDQRRRIQLENRRRRARRRAGRFLKGAAGIVLAIFLLPRAAGLASGVGQGILELFRSSGSAGNTANVDDTAQNETIAADQVSVLPQGGVDAEVLRSLRETWQNNPEAADLLAHPENYPDALLELLNKRPETLSFVVNYPAKRNMRASVDLSNEVGKGTLPFLYQWDERWGYDGYGNSIVALAGCGPTCLSMVLIDLTGDASLHPGAVAAFSEDNGYRTEGGTSWDLMTLGAKTLGITGTELPLDENRMIQELQSGHPIICSMRPGDFTDTGHFIVIAGYEDGAFLVHDPNSMDNSRTSWTYERIKGQIKNLWAYSS